MGTGERHLQGCYADRDGLRSRLAVLSRSHPGTTAADGDIIGAILEKFREHGTRAYLGEAVTLAEHMLQTAHLAEREGAPPALIAASLLHDFGYLATGRVTDAAAHGIHARHAELGFSFLAEHFVPAVVEPIRLHVAAKRYLCAVDPGYRQALSPSSIRTLELQGGPFGDAEVRAFEASPFASDAVRLRRWDDRAKLPGATTPDLEHYCPVLEAALRSRPGDPDAAGA